MSLRTTILAGLLITGAVQGLDSIRAADGPSVDTVQVRAFEVRYRPLSDAADLVGSVLSPVGVLTLKPNLKLLVVEDRGVVLGRVESLLSDFDLPPRNVEVTLNLFLGTMRPEGPDTASTRHGVIDLAPLQFTRWTSYESLGSRNVNGLEGEEVVSDISSEYRVVLTVDFVDERQGVVKFKRVSLLRRLPSPDGGPERLQNLYSVSGLVDLDKQHIFGAARDPGANQALFLTLNARAR